MKRGVVVLLAVLACVDTKPPATPIAQKTETTTELELARSLELDYRNPMRRRELHDDTHRDSEIFESRCFAGDRAACLRATTRSMFGKENLVRQIEANCQAGDELSCRFVTWDQLRGEPYPVSLSSTELRRGCSAGLERECSQLFDSSDDADVLFSVETSCLNAQHSCSAAGQRYLRSEHRDVTRARYLLELGCQSVEFGSCLDLALAYRDHNLEEPVPGRGLQLHWFICQTWGVVKCPPGDLLSRE